jgi:uncharacterized protein (TIGR00304 family)
MQLMLLGLGLIIAGILLLVAPEKSRVPKAEESMRERESMTEIRTETKGGAIIMIGPIPIVFGSDPRTTVVLMLIALGIMLAWALTFRGW